MSCNVLLFVTLLLGSTATLQTSALSQSACGSPSNPVALNANHKRVVGGTPTTTRSFPWTVMIKKYGERGVRCGGAILTHRLVLTAAHCFKNMGKSEMYMYVGKDEVEYYNVHQHIYHASDVVIHEHFNSTTSENDIALVKTSTRITFNNNVGALCFPDANFRLQADKKCLFAGYGDTQGTGFDQRLNYVQVPLVNDSLCARDDWLGRDYDVIRDVSVCAGYADGGPDACTGDSGGALVCKHLNEQKLYAYGISSWGKGCGERHKPGVYTRVLSYIDWVTKQAADLSD